MNDYYGDFTVGSVIRIKFNTLNQSLIPTAPTIAPTFAVYKNSVTESTTGLSLSAAYDGLAGFHMLTIDTSADPTFYVAGEDYDIVFTAGTVGGIDLTRVKLKSFSLENRNRRANVTQIAGQNANAATAVTFPGTVASPTNITQASGVTLAPTTGLGNQTANITGNLSGSVGSVTNPVTVGTNNDKTDYTISSIGIAAFWSTLTSGLTTVGSIGKLFVDTLDATISSRSTYAGGDTPGTSTLLGRLTAQRATNLDFLDAAISSILSSISGLNNLSAKCNLFGSSLLEVPESGSTVYEFNLVVKDDEDKLVNLDAAPTITATNAAGIDRSANLSAVTTVATGRYRFTYTVASTHAKESLRIEASGTVSTETRYAIWNGAVVDYDTTSTLVAIQNSTTDIQSRLPATLVNGRIASYVGEMASNVITSSSIAVSALNGKGDWALITDWTPTRAGYLDGVLLAHNYNTRVVAVTGAHHIAADVHEFQPGSITEVDFADNALSARVLATDTVTEIVTGVWNRDLSTFGANTAGKNLFDTVTGVSLLLSRIIDGTAALITDLRTMLVGTGTGLVKWTVNALSNAPTGGSQTVVATVAVPQLLEHTAFELDEVIVYRGCHWSFQVQNLGDLAGYTEIWFTLRKRQNDKDAESALQISLTQGLLIANKSTSVTSSDGSLTVSGQNVTIQVKQSVTQFVEPSNNYDYDLKGRNAAGQTIMLHESDKFIVKRDVTRRVS